MKFVQIVEYKTSKPDEVAALLGEWVTATEGKRTPTREMTGRDRDDSRTYMQIVEFPSYEDAMRNSGLPETNKFAEQIQALCDGPPTFRNLDVFHVRPASETTTTTSTRTSAPPRKSIHLRFPKG